jgi:hypothetical protein
MLTVSHESFEPAACADELLNGSGAVRIRGVYDDAQIDLARQIVSNHCAAQPTRMTHFNSVAESEGQLDLQSRVWNLFNKGDVFCDLITHPAIFDIMGRFLGRDFIAGSYCASRLLPGCPGQEPHIDYPYWDLYRQQSFPQHINASFPLNAQATIIIDPFTEETGATAFLPGSQRDLRYPDKDDAVDFFNNCERMIGDPGDLVFFFGAAWHCAMPNQSQQERIGLLIEFLPKFVTPVEDMLSGLSADFLADADPKVRQLLAQDYPYPQLFDEIEGGNAIGRETVKN